MSEVPQATDKSLFKKVRKNAKLTQRQASDAIPIDRRTIIRYEQSNEPPAEVVVRMDNLYKCDGELIKAWLRKLGFTGTIKFSQRKSTIWTAIRMALRKIFKLRQL